MPEFFNKAWNGFKQTFKNHFSPKEYLKVFEEAPGEIVDKIKGVTGMNIREKPLDFLHNLGTTTFALAFPAMDIMHAYDPDRQDLEYAGPFQNTATRLFDTAMGLSWALGDRNPFFQGSGWGAIPAQVAAGLIARSGVGYLGSLADRITGNYTPPPVRDSFSDSVEKEQQDIQRRRPEINLNTAKQMAVSRTLGAANDYLQNVALNW